MSTGEGLTIGPGKIRFYNSYEPTLEAGRYEAELRQVVDLNDVGDGGGGNRAFSSSQFFHVQAPRFALAPSDIHAVYPPPNHEGPFHDSIPHVVLRKRSLPWVRNLGGPEAPLPWLALLLFHGGEVPPVETVAVADLVGRGRVPVDGVLPPDIEPEPGDGERVQTIVVDKTRFRRIVAPGLEDLPYLAHVREVNTGDKELLGLQADGWFSVVLGSRLPAPGLNTVHLVSLEGWVAYLRRKSGRPRGFPGEADRVRVVSLSSWSFTATPSRGSFRQMAEDLDVGLLRVGERGRRRESGHEDETALAELFDQAIAHGYVPLSYDMRHGETSVAWYRGPLLPVVVKRADKDPFPSAESALIYDPRIGMFDVSYAVAWQIGRLLALSDPSFASALSRWRQRGQRLVDQLLEREEVRKKFEQARLFADLDAIEMEEDPDAREEDPDARKEMLIELLAELDDPNAVLKALADMVLPKPAVAGSTDAVSEGEEGESVLEVLRPTVEGKARLYGGQALADEDLSAVRELPPGVERAKKIVEVIESRLEALL